LNVHYSRKQINAKRAAATSGQGLGTGGSYGMDRRVHGLAEGSTWQLTEWVYR